MRHGQKLSATAERKVALGLAAQPLVAALVGFVVLRVVNSAPIQTAFVIAVFIGIAGVVITIGLAYPAFRWLLGRGHVSLTQTIVSGAILGNVPSAVVVGGLVLGGLRETGTMPTLGELVAFVDFASLLGSIAGATAAAVFWWIAVRHIDMERRACDR